uniref:Transmembrane protein n=1 Tax=Chrysotila carterae TaxID=13221 RepID=A0A7S4BRE3_CHRCT
MWLSLAQANFVFFNAYAFWMTALEAFVSMVLGADPFSPPLKAVFALLFAFAYYHIFIVLQQRPYMLGGLVLLMVDTVLSIVGCVVNAPVLLLVVVYGVEALLTLLILKAGVQLYWKAGDTLLL